MIKLSEESVFPIFPVEPGALGVHGDLEISLKPRLPEQEPLFWGIGELSLPIPKTLTDRVAIELSKCLPPT